MNKQNLNSFSEDVFNRKYIAENLTKIIESKSKPMVISLDSEWGTGKTTFVTMWKELLDNDSNYNSKFNTLYFNAWEHDYIKDPLLAIFSEIESQVKEEDSKLKKHLDNVKNKAKPYAKIAATTSLKVVTAGMLNLDNVNLGNYNESQLIELAGKLGDIAIKEISASKKLRAELKKEMAKYQESSNKKIVFFIDELDRCRPNFAIELLEVIKHLFDINNFVFVISIDKEQLSHSVSTIYGQNMDTVGYLRRFFDLDYKLPKIDIEKFIDDKNSITFENYYNVGFLEAFIKEVLILNRFSLRDIEKTYYYIELLLPLIKEFNCYDKEFIDIYYLVVSYIYATLIAIKIKKPILYKKIIDMDFDLNEVVNEFNIPDYTYYGESIYGWHPKPLQEVISSLFEKYLKLILKIKETQNINTLHTKDFIIGLKREDGSYIGTHSIDLLNLYRESNLNVHSKLDFLEGF
ncbi:MAG: P-loop NTPase fold protein [Paeniclostridium sordellii]|nr:P-loop NTPase fold protein [Paeniclostridium sordellii]